MTQPTDRPVTVGLDDSPESQVAAGWAAEEALHRRSRLHLVHASIQEPLTTPPTRTTDWARQLLDEVAGTLAERHPTLTVTTEVLPSAATAGMVDAAEHAEMLVLGSRQRGPVLGSLIGSVGLRVLARTTHPVVLVRHGEQMAGVERDEVVLGIEEPAQAPEPLCGFAFAAAAARQARLRVVHAWRPGTDGRSDEEMRDLTRSALSGALRHWRQRYPSVRVTEDIGAGRAADAMLTASSGAALVTVGRRIERPALSPRIGPVAHATLHHAATPVAVVPHH